MAEVVKMPRLSDTMEEGTVAKWHKSVGDAVEEGDLLAEIETDKATMDFEAFQEGTLLHIGVEEGDTAPVESILAILGEEGEDISKLLEGNGEEDKKGEDQEAEEEESEKEDEEKESTDDSASDDEDSKKEETPSPEKSEEKPARAGVREDGKIMASPLARKLADEKDIDLSDVKGTGEGGRIVKRDIDEYKPSRKAAPAADAPAEDYETVKLSQMRKTIARRLAESKFSAPHFYLTLDIDMSEATKAREAINQMGDDKVSFNDLVIKAAAVALRKHPKVNSSWHEDHIRKHNVVNIGVAVAVEEGLLVPVVHRADTKGLSQINAEVKEAAAKARDKKLQPEEMEGNTFTVSNLGMFGIEEFTAIINPPESCIMAVGAIKEVPVVRDGAIVPGKVMRVTMSCDHRVVDGATGAAFLQTFKDCLESPLRMLV